MCWASWWKLFHRLVSSKTQLSRTSFPVKCCLCVDLQLSVAQKQTRMMSVTTTHSKCYWLPPTFLWLTASAVFTRGVGRTGQTWTLTFDRLTLNLNPNLTHQVRMEDKEVAGAKPELVTKVYRCQCSTVILIHHLWLNPGGGWRGHTQDRVRYSSNQPATANFHDLDVVCVCVCVMLNQWFFPFFPVCSDKVLCSDVFPLCVLNICKHLSPSHWHTHPVIMGLCCRQSSLTFSL